MSTVRTVRITNENDGATLTTYSDDRYTVTIRSDAYDFVIREIATDRPVGTIQRPRYHSNDRRWWVTSVSGELTQVTIGPRSAFRLFLNHQAIALTEAIEASAPDAIINMNEEPEIVTALGSVIAPQPINAPVAILFNETEGYKIGDAMAIVAILEAHGFDCSLTSMRSVTEMADKIRAYVPEALE